MYCWYQSPSDSASNTTRCLPLYSQGQSTIFGWRQVSSNNSLQITLADYQQNGKYCMSGLAYPFNSTGAKCTTMTSMAQNGYALS